VTTLTLRIAQRGRRALVALTLALIVLGWAASQRAQADAVAIPGTPETVYADSLGQVQGRFTGASDGIFFSPSSNTGAAGFFVGIPAGVGQPPALLSSGSGQVFGFRRLPARPSTRTSPRSPAPPCRARARAPTPTS